MYNYYITMDSFGDDLPNNWEEIAAFLNGIIEQTLEHTEGAFDNGYDDTGLSFDGHEIVNRIWENYCNGLLKNAPTPIFD